MQGALNNANEPNEDEGHTKVDQDVSPKPQGSFKTKGGLDLEQLELVKEPKDATTSLEFLVCTLASKLSLKTPQVFLHFSLCLSNRLV